MLPTIQDLLEDNENTHWQPWVFPNMYHRQTHAVVLPILKPVSTKRLASACFTHTEIVNCNVGGGCMTKPRVMQSNLVGECELHAGLAGEKCLMHSWLLYPYNINFS